MTKPVHPHLSANKSDYSGKAEMLIAFSLLVGSLSLLAWSYSNHEAGNLLCRCVLCILNRLPEDGEYLYNRYLLLISIAWGSLIMGVWSVARHCTNRKKKRTPIRRQY